MFYFLSKPLWYLAAPSNALTIVLVAAAAASLGRRRRRWPARIAFAAALLLAAIGFGPVGTLALAPLEERFPAPDAVAPAPDGIIVLGGAVDERVARARGNLLELNEAGDRVTALLELARRFPQARLMFTSGTGEYYGRPEISEAEIVKARIGALGLDSDRLEIETKSRNTEENARFSAEILKPRPDQTWWLVTSAWHMPRSIDCFRRAGFRVVAHPVDYRTRGPSDRLSPLGPVSGGLTRFDVAAREWIGLVAYRL
ncbi:YdcF family protein [Siculibacillus lacustris]|uniref:YdcF family protein n=1 Tax=Siculibacillus lacustris TaxID=1549641 RepID=A0A4V2KTN0_9HYPH|nr:YdcF family protein [Siculibacillus lacustris]TBW37965.1 YdcF family protein [Siculibacillus lacustris]